jgi:DNA (cytosine-5)-methyltransferase 1
MKKYLFGDLFSGAGGMSYGFFKHPAFRPVFSVDAEIAKPSSGRGRLDCNATYEKNIGLKVISADLGYIEPEDLQDLTGKNKCDVLISCAPCTGFSRAVSRNHLQDDPRNNLVERTGLFVEKLRPKILLMENARELVRGNFSHHCEILNEHLSKLGYSFYAKAHMLSEFGLPQTRERSIIIAAANNARIHTLEELWSAYEVDLRAITVRHAIGDMLPLAAGESDPADPEHISPKFGKKTSLDRLHAIPHDGGSWTDLIKRPDADSLLIPSMKRYVEKGDFGSHPDVYGRLWWDRPCVTIKRECAHVGNGRYSHPEQDRLCTVREMAIMNGFPREYRFVSDSLANKYRHIGDAVPPLISFQLANICHWILTGKRPKIEECILENTSLKKEHILNRTNIQLSLPA